jgi:hypothetical protein
MVKQVSAGSPAERLGNIQLGVGDLPEQEIADAHLAGGADEQVRIGQAGRVQVRGNGVFAIESGG